LRLDSADLRAPFSYDQDSLLILPMVKATVEHGIGGHWRNERMGAPEVQELYDFPVIDHLHFGILWVFSKFISDVVLLYNLYFLLTFPLTALTAMLVFRHLGLTLPAAAVGGILYTFLPYHYQRWENHYFLAAYWFVPISLLPAFGLLKGNFPFFRRQPDGTYQFHWRSWSTLGQVVLAAATAAAGAYYAFFTCALITFAGFHAWVAFRTYRAIAAAAGVAGLIVVFGLLNHLPTYIYHARYDTNPVTERGPEEADVFGLKIAHLILPIEDHRLWLCRRIKALYNSPNRPSETENRSASLGLVGTVGLLGLAATLLLPFHRGGWPYGPIARLTLLTVLLATIGGFGAVFNLFVTASIRGYNRVSVFIAFLCLLAVLWAIDRFLITHTGRLRRWRYPIWGAVCLLGFLDQTPYGWFNSGITTVLGDEAKRFHADADFFGKIEETMPGGKVFCLPYVPYPEVPELHKMTAYEHARGYLHTQTVSWSFGAMKGREADAWQGDVATPLKKEFVEIETMLKRLVARGFDGVFIDSRGFPSSKEGGGQITAGAVIAYMNQAYAALLGKPRAELPEIHHSDKEQFFLDLRPYRDLYAQKAPLAFEQVVTQEREWVTVLWLGGFANPDTFGNTREERGNNWHRYGPPDGRVWFINPTDRERQFTIEMTFGVYSPGSYQMILSGLVNEEFEIDRKPTEKEDSRHGVFKKWTITVPPGRHPLRIRCIPPPGFVYTDYRKLCYFIRGFRMIGGP
jgi:hypothetical protein